MQFQKRSPDPDPRGSSSSSSSSSSYSPICAARVDHAVLVLDPADPMSLPRLAEAAAALHPDYALGGRVTIVLAAPTPFSHKFREKFFLYVTVHCTENIIYDIIHRIQ